MTHKPNHKNGLTSLSSSSADHLNSFGMSWPPATSTSHYQSCAVILPIDFHVQAQDVARNRYARARGKPDTDLATMESNVQFEIGTNVNPKLAKPFCAISFWGSKRKEDDAVLQLNELFSWMIFEVLIDRYLNFINIMNNK